MYTLRAKFIYPPAWLQYLIILIHFNFEICANLIYKFPSPSLSHVYELYVWQMYNNYVACVVSRDNVICIYIDSPCFSLQRPSEALTLRQFKLLLPEKAFDSDKIYRRGVLCNLGNIPFQF